MNDMSAVIIPKSDQINADDLIAGPRTIRITDVKISPGTEQPVSIFYDGDNGKPWRPCKSMSRVLVAVWGADAKAYTGRSVTLYRDPKVKWGGLEVGGIRISHMSDLDAPKTMALTETRANRKPFTVKPLANGPAPKPRAQPSAGPEAALTAINACTTQQQMRDWWQANSEAIDDGHYDEVLAAFNQRLAEVKSRSRPQPSDSGPPLSAAGTGPDNETDAEEGPSQPHVSEHEDAGEAHNDADPHPARAKADELISKSKLAVDAKGLARIVGNAQADLAAMDEDLRREVRDAFERAEARVAP